MSAAKDWKVGDVVIVTPDDSGHGHGRFLVSKVGRRWITVDAYRERRFDRETGREDSDGGGGYCYALRPERYEARKRRTRALNRINQLANSWSFSGISTDALERIIEVIEAEQKAVGR